MIRIGRVTLDVVERAALAARPREACGLLVGRFDGRSGSVASAVETANLVPQERPDRFEIDAAAHLQLQRRLRNTPLGIVGLFHSHPGGAPHPSPTDVAHAAYPGWLWLITALSGEGCESRIFVDRGGGAFEPLALRIEE